MKETIDKINEALKPYHALLTMMIFFGGLFIAVYQYVISPSDLRLSVLNESISYPSSIGSSMEKLYNKLPKNDSVQVQGTILYSFLINTTSHKRLTLSNTSDKTIHGVKFKYLNIDHLTAWGASASFLSTTERSSLINDVRYDEQQHMAYLPAIIDIPPKSEMYIDLWGTFKDQLLNDDIIATYDQGDAYIQNTYTIDGLKGYLLNYYFEIILLIVLVFCGVYAVGIKQLKEKYAAQTIPVQSD